MTAPRPIDRTVKPRVLFCTADIGCGHGRAALAVSAAMRTGWPGVQPKVVDALDTAPAWFKRIYRDAYLFGAKHLPQFNGWLYNRTDVHGIPESSGLSSKIESRATRTFRTSDLVQHADLIVCTHFLCARVLSAMRGRGKLKARLAVIVTDQHPHAVWRVAHADLFLVASQAAADELARHGIPADHIVVTGIPIDARFNQPMSRAAARSKQNLPPAAPIILLSGGGLGLGGIDRALDGILSAPGEVFTIVVCGKNAALYNRLLTRIGPRANRVRILGVTSRMHELMAAADLMVGKPGGLTTAEAAAVGLPMVLLRPIPGQEERNADILVHAGAAILHQNPFDAGRAAAILAQQPPALDELRRNSFQFGHRSSAHCAAAAALDLIRPTDEISINEITRTQQREIRLLHPIVEA